MIKKVKNEIFLFFLTIFVIKKMNIYDLIILVPIVAGFVFGLSKGFVREAISLLSIVFALIFAEMFNKQVAPYVKQLIDASEQTITVISYVLVFATTIILLIWIAKVIEKLLSQLHLSWFNSLLGGLLGGLKFAIIVSIVMNVFDALDTKFQFVNQKTKSQSVVYYPTLRLSPTLWKVGKSQYHLYKKEHSDNEKKSKQ